MIAAQAMPTTVNVPATAPVWLKNEFPCPLSVFKPLDGLGMTLVIVTFSPSGRVVVMSVVIEAGIDNVPDDDGTEVGEMGKIIEVIKVDVDRLVVSCPLEPVRVISNPVSEVVATRVLLGLGG